MNFKELMAALEKGDRPAEFQRQLDQFRAWLITQDMIRFFMADSHNYGHYATTLHVLRRFVHYFDYHSEVELCYECSMYSPEVVREKLKLLLPKLCFDGEGRGEIQNFDGHPECMLECVPLDAEMEWITLCITGGVDILDQCTPYRLHVDYVLRLEPYRWKVPSSVISDVKRVVREYTIDETIRVGYSFTYPVGDFWSMTYLFDPGEYTCDAALWELCTHLPGPAGDAARKLQYLYQKAPWSAMFHLWPVYGLHVYADNLGGGYVFGADDILLHLLLSVLTLQNHSDVRSRRAILMVVPVGETMPRLDLLQAFLAGDAALDALTAEGSPRPISKELAAVLKVQRASVQVPFPLPLADRVKVLLPKCTQADWEKHFLRIQVGTVTIALMGSLPQPIFHTLFAETELPAFFEGQGTSSLAISIGKPFLQASFNSGRRKDGGIERVKSYPAIASLEFELSEPLEQLAQIAVRRTTNYSKAEDYPRHIQSLHLFLCQALDPISPFSRYFAALRQRAQRSDKFLLGIAALMMYCPEMIPPPELASSGAASGLAEIYAFALKRAQAGEAVDLCACMGESAFTRFFSGVFPNLAVSVAAEDILPVEREGELVSVTLRGAQGEVLGTQCQFEVLFENYLDTGTLATLVTCTHAASWSLGAMSWVGFENLGFCVRVVECGAPPCGAVTARLKKIPLTLSCAFPSRDGLLVFHGRFDEPYTALDLIYQLVGGVDFVALLPEPLRSLAGFGVREIAISCLEEGGVPQSIDVVLETKAPGRCWKSPRSSWFRGWRCT